MENKLERKLEEGTESSVEIIKILFQIEFGDGSRIWGLGAGGTPLINNGQL